MLILLLLAKLIGLCLGALGFVFSAGFLMGWTMEQAIMQSDLLHKTKQRP